MDTHRVSQPCPIAVAKLDSTYLEQAIAMSAVCHVVKTHLLPRSLSRTHANILMTGRMTDASGVVLGGLDRNKDKLQYVRNLLFAACGTSLYATQYGAKLMRDMGAVDTCFAQVYFPSNCDSAHRGIVPKAGNFAPSLNVYQLEVDIRNDREVPKRKDVSGRCKWPARNSPRQAKLPDTLSRIAEYHPGN